MPEVVAKGVNVRSTTFTNDSSNGFKSGTSMASPAVAGVALLLQQHYFNVNDAFMRSASLKGLIIHTADEAGFEPGPDYEYGWGLVNANKAAELINEKAISSAVLDELTLSNGGNYSRTIMANGSGNLKISTGHNKSKFGIPVEQIGELEAIVKANNIFIRTLHIHTGSEIKDADVFVKGIEVLFDLIPHFPELEVIDLGGGFKVPYMPGEKTADVASIGQKLKQAFDVHPLANNKKLQVWFEPGKFLVSECGYLLAQVNVLKQNGDTIIAGVNTGLNHLIRPMMYDAYHHISNLSNPTGEEKKYMVTGYICETDTFASDRLLPEIKEGDLLCFHNAGAYGFEMSSNFNSRLKPAEVLVKDGEVILIRKRESFEDLLKNII